MDGIDTDVGGCECPVCHENYTEPKILPCAHLLCRDCLVTWMKTNPEALCPLCRCSIVVLQDSKTPVTMSNEYAESLPTDHAMSAMVESAKILSQMFVCVVHTDAEAASLCVHCSAMLCENCVDAHRKLPATANHKLEDLATLTLKRLAASKPAHCFYHPEKISKLICKTHNVLVCRQCVISQHRACPEVTSLPELYENCKQSFIEMKAKLREAESAINHVLSKMEEIIETEENTLNVASKDIDKVLDNIISWAEDCRSRLKRRVLDAEEVLKSAVQERKTKLNDKRGKVMAHIHLMQRITDSSHCSSHVVMEPKLRSRIIDLDLDMLLPLGTEPLTLSTMTFDEKALAALKQDLEKIGDFVSSPASIIEKKKWSFHINHGKNVILSDNGQTAENHNQEWGIVLSNEPLKINKIYEIRVESTGSGNVRLGVLTDNPDRISVPLYAKSLSSAIGISENNICVNTKMYENNYGQALKTIKAGSCVGLLIDSSFSLHLYMDGKDQGVAWHNVRQPCYAMIDIGGICTKVLIAEQFISMKRCLHFYGGGDGEVLQQII